MKLINVLLNAVKDMKIKKKLIISYVIAVLMPVLIVGIYLTSGMRKMAIDKTTDEACINTDRIEDRLNGILKIISYVSDRIYFNEKLQNIVLRHYTSVAEVVNVYMDNAIFDEYMRYYKEIASIRFYVDNQSMLDDSQFIKSTDEIKRTDWYKNAVKGNGRIIWTYRYDDIVKKNYLSLIRLVKYDNKNKLGVLVINVNEDSLREIIKDEPFYTIISMNNGLVVIDNNENEAIEGSIINLVGKDKLKSSLKNYKFTDEYNNQKSSIIMNSFSVEKASSYYLQIFTIVPIDNIIDKANQISLRGFSIIGLSFILSLGLIIIFVDTFSKKILLLRKEMHRVVSGDFNIREGIDGKDEIGELYDDLNKMIESIKQLINEVYVEKLQKEQLINKQREAEFKMLASQINPHFLYNTLETIRMKAHCSGQKEIANIVKMLGKIMRRNLEVSHKEVSLKSEIDLVKSYLEIQKLRFGEEKVNYSINIFYNIEEYNILPLLLQPIVENAFVHGLENKEGTGIINIVIREAGEFLIIDISDNGIGIDVEKLAYINKKINSFSEDDKKSIGLSNINQRIKLRYGESYGIRIDSKLDEGTKVSIFLPIGEGEFNSAKGSNS